MLSGVLRIVQVMFYDYLYNLLVIIFLYAFIFIWVYKLYTFQKILC